MIAKGRYLVESILAPQKQYILKELENECLKELLKVKCPFLLKFIEIFEYENEWMIVMEYFKDGDLRERIRRIPPTDFEIYRFLYESSMAVKVLHQNDIIHGNIEPSSFFFTLNGEIKLGDFGSTVTQKSLEEGMEVGSCGYTAPEILNGEKASKETDIFSLGVTVMEFIIGHNPFRTPDNAVKVTQVLSATLAEDAHTHQHSVMTLTRAMVDVNPRKRPTIDEVLSHQAAHVPLLLSAIETINTTMQEKIIAERNGIVWQCEAMSKRIEDFGYKKEKFIPTGKTWVKKNANACDWELKTNDNTFQITSSSVVSDNYGPCNLFNGQSETLPEHVNVWHSDGVSAVQDLWLKLKKRESFHYVYMQGRNDPCIYDAPYDFDVRGSNDDGNSYDVLREVRMTSPWKGMSEDKYFALHAKKPYAYYNIHILRSDNGSRKYVCFSQLNFLVLKNKNSN